jgi:hypothetical protein
MNRLLGCIHSIARPKLYSIEQWVALTLSIICLGVDACAVFLTVAGSNLSFGSSNFNMSGHEAMMWTAEGMLALAVFGLLAFAFSKRVDLLSAE